MAEQEPAVTRGWVFKMPDGRLFVRHIYLSKDTAVWDMPDEPGWTIVPVEIRELSTDQIEQD